MLEQHLECMLKNSPEIHGNTDLKTRLRSYLDIRLRADWLELRKSNNDVAHWVPGGIVERQRELIAALQKELNDRLRVELEAPRRLSNRRHGPRLQLHRLMYLMYLM